MAEFVLLVVNRPDKLDQVLHAWESLGVTGVTILESSGLGRAQRLRDDLPLFPSLRSLFEAEEYRHRTIFTVIGEEINLDNLIAATERILGNLDEPNTGILITWPVSRVRGLAKKKLTRGS